MHVFGSHRVPGRNSQDGPQYQVRKRALCQKIIVRFYHRDRIASQTVSYRLPYVLDAVKHRIAHVAAQNRPLGLDRVELRGVLGKNRMATAPPRPAPPPPPPAGRAVHPAHQTCRGTAHHPGIRATCRTFCKDPSGILSCWRRWPSCRTGGCDRVPLPSPMVQIRRGFLPCPCLPVRRPVPSAEPAFFDGSIRVQCIPSAANASCSFFPYRPASSDAFFLCSLRRPRLAAFGLAWRGVLQENPSLRISSRTECGP